LGSNWRRPLYYRRRIAGGSFREATYKDIASLAVLGFFIAVFVEYKGLFLNRWHYLEAMPVISGLGVGLSPILQMSLLLPVSVFLTKYLLKKI